jgi:hypothetical protein
MLRMSRMLRPLAMVSLPVVGLLLGGAEARAQGPIIIRRGPVIVRRAPVVVQPAPVIVRRPPVIIRRAPVIVRPWRFYR